MARHLPARAKKNFVPFLAVPLLVPALVGGVGLYAAYSAAGTAADKYVNTPAVLGGAVGYTAAAVAKQSAPVQMGSALIGYISGLMIGKWIAERKKQKEIANVAKTQGLTEDEAKKVVADKEWCQNSPVLSWFAPSCY
jgi:Na+/glutamate symporter